MKKNLTRQLLWWAGIMTTQLVIYWIWLISRKIKIAIDLSKQIKSKDPQQINFIGKLENQNNETTMFFVIEKSENYFWIFAKFCKYFIKMETQKTVNLLNSSDNEFSKLATKKWYAIDSETKGDYSHHNPIKFLTSSLEF